LGLTAPGRIPKFAPDTSAVFEKTLGAIAQLGERYNGIVEVTGSIPVGSTNKIKGLALRCQALVVFWGDK
jgi:hypothetical protein